VVSVVSALIVSVAGGIETACGGAGGIQLAGGTSEEIVYTNVRTKLQSHYALPFQGVIGASWSASVGTLVGPAGASAGAIQGIGPVIVHNGAVLSNIRMFIKPSTHTGLPATLPELQVHRYAVNGGTNVLIGDTTASAANFGAWNATAFWDIPCNLGGAGANVIDRTQYNYHLLLLDEFGSNAVAGNIYYGFVATFTTIGNMAFA
jgi:hypothetical protein